METISADELKNKIGSKEEFELVHVLSPEEFKKEQVPGSINIPLGDIGKRREELDKDKEIIVYCKNFDCDASPKAAKKLEKLGFEKVVDYEGGMENWKEKGYLVESLGSDD